MKAAFRQGTAKRFLWINRSLTAFLFLSAACFLLADAGAGSFAAGRIPRASSWVELGKNLIDQGEYQQALEYLSKHVSQASGQDPERLEAYMHLWIASWHLDRFDEAKEYLDRAFELSSAPGRSEERRVCETGLKVHRLFVEGLAWRGKGDLAQADGCFEKAVRLAAAIPSPALELKILRIWSMNHVGEAENSTFLELNKRAFDMALALNQKTEVLRTSLNMGASYARLGNYSRSLSCYTMAVECARATNDDKALAGCLTNIAHIYTSFGDHTRAFEYASQAIKISQHGDMPRPLATQFINLGLAFQARSRLEGTNEYYPRALECFEAGYREAMESGQASVAQSALANSALVYASLQEYEKALAILMPALKEAKKALNSALSARLLNTLGLIYLERKDFQQAEAYFRAALTEAQRSGDIVLKLNATYGLGRCQEEKGAFDQAVYSYNATIRTVDQLGSGIVNDANRSDFVYHWRKLYQQLIELDNRLLKKTGSGIFELDIFANVERMKSRSFLEYLERRSRLKETGAADITKTREEKIKEERLGYLKQLSQDNLTPHKKGELESEIRQREEMLSTIFMERYLRSGQQEIRTEPVAVGVLQQDALRPDTALVEYFLGDERSYLILVTSTLFRSFELPAARQIHDSLIGYLNFLADPKLPQDRGLAAAQRLYQELFSPADRLLPKTVSRLIIVPDGILFGLPFETLLRPAERGGHEYLLGRYTISYSPSASALFYLQRKPRRSAYPKDLLALGDPVYQDQGLSTKKNPPSPSRILSEIYRRNGYTLGPLPSSRSEVERISKRFAADKKNVYLGRQVTEKFLKTQDLSVYRVIHFAGHALSDETYPLRSALVLSLSDDDEDGFLQASEMYSLRLDADLVVLSGCQTGGGKNIRNEGILGLPRIFFYLGARSVVSTLWSIDDRATARFMDDFYSGLSKGLGKAEALRASKKRMIASRRYAHPYFWSPFVLTGEPQTSSPSF